MNGLTFLALVAIAASFTPAIAHALLAERPPMFTIYACDLCHASVCTNLPDDEATFELNLARPTGISSRWQISPDPFADGSPNPSPCPDLPECRHLLYVC